MYEIDSKLRDLQAQGKPIQVGLIGAGQMGTDIVAQVECMVGMEIPIVVDLKTETAVTAYRIAGFKGEVIETNDLSVAEKAIKAGKKVATTNYQIATNASPVQVVIDATG